MRVAIVVIAFLSTTTGIFLACSSDTPATTETGDSGGVFATDTGGPVDSGSQDTGNIYYSPTGCPIINTDYVSGTKAESLPTPTGGVAWNNPNGALSEDGDFATVTLNDGEKSAELRVSEFNLKVPENADTWGIEVQLKRRAPDGGVADEKIDIFIEGKPTIFKYVASGKDGGRAPWPVSIVGVHHYGQAVDTWGVDLFPTDVNKASFAARVIARRTDNAGLATVTATVDSLKVAVHYCTK